MGKKPTHVSFCLSLRRIQAVSSGNQKEVFRHHKAPEKSKKRWDKPRNILINTLTQIYFKILRDGVSLLDPLVPALHQWSRWFRLNWLHLEDSTRNDSWLKSKCLAQFHRLPSNFGWFARSCPINQRNDLLSWLCFHWPLLLCVIKLPFSHRTYCALVLWASHKPTMIW